MGQRENIKPGLGGVLMALALAIAPTGMAQAADDYLSILEAEASDTGDSAPTAVAPEKSAAKGEKIKHVTPGKIIEPGLSFEDFEETLSNRYSGSNFLYVKLTAGKRKGVYKFYQSDNRISSVREEIVRLLSSG